MKRIFKCSQCGDEIEIEADHFIPGVSGQLVDDNGVIHTFVDPTSDKTCDICVAVELGMLVDVKKE